MLQKFYRASLYVAGEDVRIRGVAVFVSEHLLFFEVITYGEIS